MKSIKRRAAENAEEMRKERDAKLNHTENSKRGFTRNKFRVVIAIFSVVLLGFSALWLYLPWLANHYNFALPVSNGLPYRISYNNRTYATSSVCAGADWCKDKKPDCRTEEYLVTNNLWPLKSLGDVPSLFSSAHLIMLPASSSNPATTVVYVLKDTNCYIVYALEGGL